MCFRHFEIQISLPVDRKRIKLLRLAFKNTHFSAGWTNVQALPIKIPCTNTNASALKESKWVSVKKVENDEKAKEK